LCGELGALTRCKTQIAHTAKKTKAGVIGRHTTKTLKRNYTLKSRRRLNYAQKQKGHKLKLGGKRALHHKITSAELGMEFFCIPNANYCVCIPSHILILDLFTYNKIGRFFKKT
jgi:hypothetical protein